MPFSKSTADAVKENRCGACNELGTLAKYIECKSLDTGFAPLFVCKNCFVVYNATAESDALDIIEWQKRWAQDPDFYKVPDGEDLASVIRQYNATFDFFQNDLDRKFEGNYLEIGAGNGVMAVAALNYFENAYVFDHVRERLEISKSRSADPSRYHILTTDSIHEVQADVVLIWHAMEHFLAPGDVFKLCSEALKGNGVLLMQVPILSYEHVYPGHYYFYNEIALTKMAQAAGLEPVKFYYDHAMNAMTAALRKP